MDSLDLYASEFLSDFHASRLNCRSVWLGRSLRKESSNHMAFPHPQSRKNKNRNEDKASGGGVVWNLVKRAVNVTEYRNAKDEVNPAKNRTCSFGGGLGGDEGRLLQSRFHGVLPPFRYCCLIRAVEVAFESVYLSGPEPAERQLVRGTRPVPVNGTPAVASNLPDNSFAIH